MSYVHIYTWYLTYTSYHSCCIRVLSVKQSMSQCSVLFARMDRPYSAWWCLCDWSVHTLTGVVCATVYSTLWLVLFARLNSPYSDWCYLPDCLDCLVVIFHDVVCAPKCWLPDCLPASIRGHLLTLAYMIPSAFARGFYLWTVCLQVIAFICGLSRHVSLHDDRGYFLQVRLESWTCNLSARCRSRVRRVACDRTIQAGSAGLQVG